MLQYHTTRDGIQAVLLTTAIIKTGPKLIKGAMEALKDSGPGNDAAAEQKLRSVLKKAAPLLTKLSTNIGKGVLVRLGLTRDKLVKDALSVLKQQVDAELQKTGSIYSIQEKEWVAKHGPNATKYNNNSDGDKAYLEAKQRYLNILLTEEEKGHNLMRLLKGTLTTTTISGHRKRL